MKISIVIPAYNEEKRIGRTLEEYGKYFEEKKRMEEISNFEILVVINNTQDKTEEIFKRFNKKYKEIKYLNFKKGGKGFAIIEGFKDAINRENDLIGFVDADCSTSPEEYFKLVGNIGEYDGIIASRYVTGAVVNPPPTLSRLVSSRIFNFIMRVLLVMNYEDTQCGAKVFRREAVKKIIGRVGTTKWAFDVDLLYQLKHAHLKILEFPTVWSDREYSHINLKQAGPSMFLAIVRLRLLNSFLRGFVKLYDEINGLLRRA